MRRKLFCILLTLMAILFFIDMIGINLKPDQLTGFIGTERSYRAEITGIQYEDEEHYYFTARLITADEQKVNIREKVLLSCYDVPEKPWELFHSIIEFTCMLEKPAVQRNPYCFDYSRYLKSRGIGATGNLSGYNVQTREYTLRQKYERWLFEKRCLFESELRPETKGIILGVLFGDTAFIDDNVYEDFRNNGTAHVLAVSGLHVGILYGLYKKTAGNSKNPAALFFLAILLFSYGVLSMWSPSVIRASLMIVMSVIARLTDMRYDMLTAMSTVGLMLIAANPYVIFGAGFQMSFLAIISIAFLRPLIPDKIPEFLTTVLAVNCGLLLYQIYQFNYISLVSVAANIPIVFLAGYLVPAALIAFGLFCITGQYDFMRPVTEGMAMVLTELNELSALNGYGSVDVVRPPLWFVLSAAGIIFFLSSETYTVMKLRMEHKKIAVCILAVCLGACTCHMMTFTPLTADDIVFVDVGQGDCIHLRDGNKDMLIDGGGSLNYNVGKKTLKPYLLRNGAWNLDLALVTHEHMDHYKGIQELEQEYPVKKVMKAMTAGQTVKFSDNISIETLWPETAEQAQMQDANENCSVFMVYCRGRKILVTGDLDEKGERDMIEKYRGTDKLKADILKIGHHGSSSSTCQEFLDEVDPVYAVIQSGKNNYGHPSAEVVEKLEKSGIIILRNDYNGAVGFSFGKERIDCHFMID